VGLKQKHFQYIGQHIQESERKNKIIIKVNLMYIW